MKAFKGLVANNKTEEKILELASLAIIILLKIKGDQKWENLNSKNKYLAT